MTRRDEIRAFVIEYLNKNFCTDALDQKFHNDFFGRFGGKWQATGFGSQPVFSAQRWLKRFYDAGVLDRDIVPLGSATQPGFPKWVYSYTLRTKEAQP